MFFLPLFVGLIISLSINAQTDQNTAFSSDSSLVLELSNIEFDRFIDKKVAHFLNNDTIKLYREWNFLETKPYSLAGLQIWYSDNIYINIFVYKMKHQKKENGKKKWSFRLLRKEKISKIVLINRFDIIKCSPLN